MILSLCLSLSYFINILIVRKLGAIKGHPLFMMNIEKVVMSLKISCNK
jgi:hypothetical protein